MKRFASPVVFLFVGLLLGYWIGYTDAWRGEGTLGARMAMVKYKVSPSGGVSDARQANAEKMKNHIQAKSGIDSILPP
jgi:hypothetical protein